ncbi:MAG: dihydropteroate synthase [Chromatiales bacterium]
MSCAVEDLEGLKLSRVEGRKCSALWNGLIDRYHYLGYRPLPGAFAATGYAVLLGTSRKRFMGAVCAEQTPRELVGATCATTALGVAAGVRYFRVHDVKANRQAADVALAIMLVQS